MKISLSVSLGQTKKTVLVIISLLSVFLSSAQTSKQVNHQYQSWFSVNTVTRINEHWAILADGHIRRNHFLAQSSFEFIRSGIQ
ncbi:MAG TPA: hypothetical protein VI461_01910 [Chitinophagaceae bacterium]|nr:hypothetical protein [Chitinophagaceae bacterium]